jgi:hypothetical protein
MPRKRARLADLYPQLVEQYSDSNAGPFDELWANPTPKLWWRCAVGHEFEETAATRAKTGRWKAGDWRACPMCAGLIVDFGCGHRKRYSTPVDVEAIASMVCSTCRWDAFAAHGEAAGAAARQLSETLPIDHVAIHLRPAVKRIRTEALTDAWLAEHAHGQAGALAAAVEEQRMLDSSSLVPAVDALRAPAAAGRRVDVGGSAVWAAGLLHAMTGEVLARPLHVPRPELVWLLRDVAPRASTGVITQSLQRWAEATGLQSAVEVTVPVPNDAGHWGRVDLILTARDGRALVIEIDRTHKPWSLAKLRHAQDAGAAAVWIRWGKGPFTKPVDIATVVVR